MLTVASIAKNSNAQENKHDIKIDTRDMLFFGLKIGANYSNVYDTKGDAFQASPKFGLATGGFVSIPIGRYFGIQPELLFSQKGFKATSNTYDLTRTTSYLDVPIFFAFKPFQMLTLLAGPQYSYLMKQQDVFATGTTSIAQEQDFRNDNIRKNTLCFVTGADLNFQHIVLGARAGWDVQNNNGDGTSTDPRYKNVWYQATIGYRF